MLGLGTPVALGHLEDLISSLARHHRAFYTCHLSVPPSILLVQDHALDGGLVGLVGVGGQFFRHREYMKLHSHL